MILESNGNIIELFKYILIIIIVYIGGVSVFRVFFDILDMKSSKGRVLRY